MKNKFFRLIIFLKLWKIYSAIYRFNQKAKTKEPWILGRAACLGTDTYRLLNTHLPLVNIQKGRVDYLLSVNVNPGKKANTAQIASYILRNDIKNLIVQEELAELDFFTRPAMIYMDSYSELTDQLFVSRIAGTSFCANYSDVDGKFTKAFICQGLLDTNDLTSYYSQFFSMMRKKFGNIQIVFIHFPTTLEKREIFRVRHQQIKKAIAEVRAEFLPFDIYEVPDAIVNRPEDTMDDFPYHYSESVDQYLCNQINQKYFN